jgi:hypothetical protein
MNRPAAESMLDAQVDALLQRVSQHRERRTSEIRAGAARQAVEIVRGARAEARENLHQAVARERTRIAQCLVQTEGRAELESRQRAQLQTRTLLGEMWERIAGALEARWRAGPLRSAWIAAAVQQAGILLGGRDWRIEYAAGVSAPDRERGTVMARAAGAHDVAWQLEPQLRAGLRVRTSGACVDATLEGLLARREDVEAAFLSEYLAVGGPLLQERAPAAPAQPVPDAPGPKP